MNPITNIATKAVKSGGKVVSYGFVPDNSQNDSKAQDYLAAVEKKAEEEIINTIKRYYPEHKIYNTKNKKIHGDENSDYIWAINPITSKSNFIRGIPVFACAVTILIKNKIYTEAIFNPITNDLYTATEGEGARCNNYRIRSKENTFVEAVTVHNNEKAKTKDKDQTDLLNTLINKNIKIVSTGCKVMDMAYLATNKIDAIININEDKNQEQITQGYLVTKESGLIISHINSSKITASYKTNMEIMQDIKKVQ